MRETGKYSKQDLFDLLNQLEIQVGGMPFQQDWKNSPLTPSNMPIKMLFGNWTKFLIAAGRTPRKPYLSERAKTNSVKARKGKPGGNNQGGRIKDKFGYVQIWMPKHPNAKLAGYVHEHRLVMSQKLGRPLESWEHVHHINAIKDDNRLSNLQLMTKKVHHGEVVCPHCNEKFLIR